MISHRNERPTDPMLRTLYGALTKSDLFFVAMTAFELMKGEDAPYSDFIPFVLEEANLQRTQKDRGSK